MPKLTVEPHRTLKRGKERWTVHVPEPLRELHGGKTRRFFRLEDKARKFAAELNSARAVYSKNFSQVESRVRSRLWAVWARLGESITEVEAAAEAWLSQRKVNRTTLAVAIKECIHAKQLANRALRYRTNYGSTLNQFAAGREDRPVSSIAPQEIEEWLNGYGWAAETKRGNLNRLHTLFSFAKKRGYTASNPAAAVERPARDPKPPGILTPEECASLLRVCREQEPGLVPYFAIALFAGVRPSEIQRLTWDQVKGGFIEIQARSAKTRRRRLVDIMTPLNLWLALGGELPPGPAFRERFRQVRRLAKVNYTQDCMRHSFCSYALPIHGATRVALMAGHSEAVLFSHYREIVLVSAAQKFWALSPEKVLGTVSPQVAIAAA